MKNDSLYIRRVASFALPIAARVRPLARGWGAVSPFRTRGARARADPRAAGDSAVGGGQAKTVAAFVEQVEYNGRRMAAESSTGGSRDSRSSTGCWLWSSRAGLFRHANNCAVTGLVLNRSYYQVRRPSRRPSSACIMRRPSPDLDQLLDLLVRIPTRTFGAQSPPHLLDTARKGKLALFH